MEYKGRANLIFIAQLSLIAQMLVKKIQMYGLSGHIHFKGSKKAKNSIKMKLK